MPDPDEISGQVTEGGVPVEDAVVAALRQEDAVDLSQAQATEIEALAKLTDVNGEYIFEQEELFGDAQNYHVVAHKDAGNQRRGQQNYPYVEGVGTSIPDSVVDSFEDQNIDEYFGDTDEYSIVSSPTVDGDYALQSSGINSDHDIYSTSGLDVYPEAGFPFEVSTHVSSGSNAKFYFGVQDADNKYEIFFDRGGSEFSLLVYNDGSSSVLDSVSNSVPNNTWMRSDIDWQSDGTISVDIVDGSTTLASLSVNDESFTSGGIGFGAFNLTATFDYVYIKP